MKRRAGTILTLEYGYHAWTTEFQVTILVKFLVFIIVWIYGIPYLMDHVPRFFWKVLTLILSSSYECLRTISDFDPS